MASQIAMTPPAGVLIGYGKNGNRYVSKDGAAVAVDSDDIGSLLNAGWSVVSAVAITPRKPRIVSNTMLLQTDRYPTASVFGTGVQTQTTETNANGVTNGLLQMDSGSAGRAFWGRAITFAASTWYALTFEVSAISGTGTDVGVQLTAGTGTFAQPNLVTGAKILAGGIGRYVSTFYCTGTGTITVRIGVGLAGNQASQSLTIKNLMLEPVSDKTALTPSEFCYPAFSIALDYNNSNSVDINTNKVINNPILSRFYVRPYSNVFVVGDSRSDEVNNIPGQLNTLMMADGSGVCNWHAEAGWTTVNAVGPFTKKGVSLTFDKAISGALLTRTFSTDGAEEIYDMPAYAMPFDTLFICDFGINDINSAGVPQDGAASALSNIISMCQKAVSRGMKVILSDNNPFKAHAIYTAAKLTATKWLNNELRNYAAVNGHLFVSMYVALGDSTDPDKLSDGAGTTPNYSQDALHLNDAGSTAYATAAKTLIDASR